MAIRIIKPQSGSSVCKFSANIPAHIFFQSVNVEKQQFANCWKNLGNDKTATECMDVNTNIDAIKEKFKENRCNWVADRDVKFTILPSFKFALVVCIALCHELLYV